MAKRVEMKTIITIPISKETSFIFSEDQRLLSANIAYAMSHIEQEIKIRGFTTVANIFDALGLQYPAETCGMIVYDLVRYEHRKNQEDLSTQWVDVEYFHAIPIRPATVVKQISHKPKRKNYNA